MHILYFEKIMNAIDVFNIGLNIDNNRVYEINGITITYEEGKGIVAKGPFTPDYYKYFKNIDISNDGTDYMIINEKKFYEFLKHLFHQLNIKCNLKPFNQIVSKPATKRIVTKKYFQWKDYPDENKKNEKEKFSSQVKTLTDIIYIYFMNFQEELLKQYNFKTPYQSLYNELLYITEKDNISFQVNNSNSNIRNILTHKLDDNSIIMIIYDYNPSKNNKKIVIKYIKDNKDDVLIIDLTNMYFYFNIDNNYPTNNYMDTQIINFLLSEVNYLQSINPHKMKKRL